MKKLSLLSMVAGALILASCNSTSTKTEGNADSLATVDEHAGHNHDHEGHDHEAVTQSQHANPVIAAAENEYNKAKADLDAAIAKGDKAAEETARKAVADAKAAWDKAVTATEAAVDAGKSAVDKAGEKIEGAAVKTGEAINTAAEKTETKAKEAVEGANTKLKNVKEALKQ